MKYCANCGTSMEDGATFCPNCGAAANTEAAPAAQPTYTQPTYTAPAVEVPNAPLVLAIVGCVFGCSCYFSFVGIILCAIARSKVKSLQNMGATGGKLKAAGIVSLIGLIVSIVLTVIMVLAFIVGFAYGLSNY